MATPTITVREYQSIKLGDHTHSAALVATLTACGGGGGGSATPTTSTTPTTPITPTTPTTPIPTTYFSEISNAFTDPNTVLRINDSVIASFVVATAVDMDNDGRMELVLMLSNWVNSSVLLPCPNRIAIFSLNAQNKFVETTTKFIDGPTDISSCGSSYKVFDANNDGKKDIFYVTTQEDGRSPSWWGEENKPSNWTELGGRIVALMSNSTGKYNIQKFGALDNYHQGPGYGRNKDGSFFITSTGFHYGATVEFGHQKYSYLNDQFVNDISTLPLMSPNGIEFFSTQKSGASDVLLQVGLYPNVFGLDAYTLDASGNWNKTDSLQTIYPIVATEKYFYNGNTGSIDIMNADGQMVLGVDPCCGNSIAGSNQIKLTPQSKPIALFKVSLLAVKDGSMPFCVELDITGSGGLARCIWAGPAPADCLANA